MWGSDGKLCLSEKERGNVWKDYKETVMNEANNWDHNVEGGAVESPVGCVSRDDMVYSLREV